MLWQLLHVTSFSWCLPDVQNARFRLPEWQVMQTAVRASAVPPLANGLAGLFLVGILQVLRRIPVARLAHAAVGVALGAVRRQVDRVPLRLVAIGAHRRQLLFGRRLRLRRQRQKRRHSRHGARHRDE